MLKISVIIPIYNAAETLRKCLDSVQNQHFKNLEILLIDDGSTDDSPAICDEYAAKDERFIVLRHDENLGTAAARNTGLDNATGDFVYFLDANLWIEPGCITRLAKTMVDDKADMSICSFITEFSGNKSPNYLAYTPFGVWTPRKWVENCIKLDNHCDFLWNRMFKRRLFAGSRFMEGNCYAETALLPEITEYCGTISTFDRILIHYPILPGGKERSSDARVLDKFAALDRKREVFEEFYPDLAWFVDRQIVMHCLTVLRLRARYGTCDEVEAALPELLDRLATLSAQKKVCTGKLRMDCLMALKAPGVFTSLAKGKKE